MGRAGAVIALIGIPRRLCVRHSPWLPAAALLIAAGLPLPVLASPAPELVEAAAAIGEISDDLDAARAETARVRAALAELAQVAPDAAANSAAARLAVRVNQLEQDLRAATGRIEEVSFKVRRLEERIDKFIADVDYRLSDQGREAPGSPRASDSAVPPPSAGGPRVLGQGVPSASAAPAPAPAPEASAPTVPPQAPATAPQTAALGPSGSPRDDYARAFGLLQKGSYAEAEAAFTGFLEQHKGDPLAENARYWLGETYYARADYQRAAESFLDAYEKSRTGAKAPDTLLKLGLSLAGLGKTREACTSLRELARAFPDAAPAVKDRAKLEQQKLRCP